jgi:hypothetical protein
MRASRSFNFSVRMSFAMGSTVTGFGTGDAREFPG